MTKKQVLYSLRERIIRVREVAERNRLSSDDNHDVGYFSGCVDSYDLILGMLDSYGVILEKLSD